MTDLIVTCECGYQISLRASMAGSRVRCPCGRTVLVPSFRDQRMGDEFSDGMAWRPAGTSAAPVTPNGPPFSAPWTSDPNPYASPTADLELVKVEHESPERTLGWLLFSFKGRIPRRAYWGATIGATVVFFVALVGLATIVGEDSPVALAVLVVLYIPAMWISLATQIKRWHDRDKSGWWFLINFIPYIGGLWVFIECGCLRGTKGPNSFGPDPT